MLRVLGKMAGKRLSSDRVFQAGIEAAQTTARAAARASHILFLEIAGVFFTGFGVAGTGAAIREYRLYAAGRIGPGKVVLATCFAAVFFYFAASSFWKAKKR